MSYVIKSDSSKKMPSLAVDPKSCFEKIDICENPRSVNPDLGLERSFTSSADFVLLMIYDEVSPCWNSCLNVSPAHHPRDAPPAICFPRTGGSTASRQRSGLNRRCCRAVSRTRCLGRFLHLFCRRRWLLGSIASQCGDRLG